MLCAKDGSLLFLTASGSAEEPRLVGEYMRQARKEGYSDAELGRLRVVVLSGGMRGRRYREECFAPLLRGISGGRTLTPATDLIEAGVAGAGMDVSVIWEVSGADSPGPPSVAEAATVAHSPV